MAANVHYPPAKRLADCGRSVIARKNNKCGRIVFSRLVWPWDN